MSNPAQRRTVHPFAEQGKFTAVHNSVFDVIMPSLPPNAFKVLCFVIRKTVGWQKESDQLAYSQIAKGTGIKSPATLSSAIEVLVSRKYILSTSDGKWEATEYRLNTDLEIEVTPTTENEVEESATKNEVTTEIVVATTSKTVVVPTSKIEDTKERLKEKKERGGETHAPAVYQTPAVVSYTNLTGRTPNRTTAEMIAAQVKDIAKWEREINRWLASDFKPGNVIGMLDWYHGKGKHQQNGSANLNRPAADLPLVTAAPKPKPEDRRANAERYKAILEETRLAGK